MNAADLLSERQDFLYVYVVPSSSGSGYDVVMRMDGTYTSREGAEGAAIGIRQWMDLLTDVRSDKRKWWHGAPWRKGSK